MPIPSLTDAQIDRYSPFDEAVVKDGLRERDDWNYSDATNGGSGIAPNVLAFGTALVGHTHDGTAGQGAKISAAGIASNAVNAGTMIGSLQVTQAKVDDATMQTANFADNSCTAAKFYQSQGTQVSGTWSYDFDTEPPLSSGIEYLGQTHEVANPKGRICIVVPDDVAVATCGEWHIRSITASTITLGLNAALVASRYPGSSGTATYSFQAM